MDPRLTLGAAVLGFAVSWIGTLILPALLRCLGLERTNFSGEPIGTGGGVLLVACGALGALVQPERSMIPLTALLGFGLLGFLDDRWGTSEFKGLRGHLRALRQGRVTTGLVKAVGGGVLGLGLAWWLHAGLNDSVNVLGNVTVRAPLIALCANLLNLLDLRPLRSLKGFWLLGLPLFPAGTPVLAAVMGATFPYSRLEAQRSVMLGDTGSNALGGLIGVTMAAALPLPVAALALGVLVVFHLWAERHSLSGWSDRHPTARRLDDLGWRRAPGRVDEPKA